MKVGKVKFNKKEGYYYFSFYVAGFRYRCSRVGNKRQTNRLRGIYSGLTPILNQMQK